MKEYSYEWDEIKRQANFANHGVNFRDVVHLIWDQALTIDQVHQTELRHLSYAPIDDRLYAIVWTQREAAIRVISFRKANAREVAKYEKTIQN